MTDLREAAAPAVATVTDLRVEDGTASVWFAYDVGQQIDLEQAQQAFAADHLERERIRHERCAPDYLQFHPAPLRLGERMNQLTISGFRTEAEVESTLYDFGAVSIAYRIPIGGRSLAELHALAIALDQNQLLMTESKTRVRALVDKLGAAVRKPGLADLVEDYTVFHVQRWSPAVDPEQIINANRTRIAGMLRAESEAMRDSELTEALQSRIAYGLQDYLVVDWNGALLFDPLGEDTLAVLEFANVELLEMRFLDDRLDGALERSHATLRVRSGPHSFWSFRWGETGENMRRISNLQIESALMFESVNNAIKMLGDQFLARVYRLAAQRLHIDAWDASILRKLQTLESIYSKLHDEGATRRMEALEWIIIVLIVISIVVPFLVGGAH